MTLNQLLEKMWQDYCGLNPSAKKIYDLFTAEGEKVVNDHIALRTFNHPRLGVDVLAQSFVKMGYQEKGTYTFEQKKLFAKHYEHTDKMMPKVFISELLIEKCSPLVQKVAHAIAEQIPDSVIAQDDFCVIGRPWKISYATYLELAKESEYASWLSAIGYRPNHFTVYVNHMKKYNSVQAINEFLSQHGYRLNTSGGAIKGTPAQLLEQSSTLAEEVAIQFDEGVYKIPGCYYEFAKRYPAADGELYQGFIAASADKIFESTNRL